MPGMQTEYTRRQFLRQAGAAAIAPLIITGAGAATRSPNEKVNVAAVGVGGRGGKDLAGVAAASSNIVALCDVDESSLDRAARQFPKAARFTDWRKLLDQKGIDAVIIATPDHMHAPIALGAIRRGMHVYVEKPLTWSLHEARQLTLAAREHRVVTQMGNQHHNEAGMKRVVEEIQAGAIGRIREAHVWSNRPIWPQAMERPQGSMPVPETLHWDEWIGVAPYRDYYGKYLDPKEGRGAYHPFTWRGWLDFGTGALGDMGCHLYDAIVWALELGPPSSVKSSGPKTLAESYPAWSTIECHFAGTKHTRPDGITVTWYDGGKKPPASVSPLLRGIELPSGSCLFIGEEGALMGAYSEKPALFPKQKFANHAFGDHKTRDHYAQWIDAIRGEDKTTSHFDYAGPLTETVLIGNVAMRFPGETLEWDAAALRFTNKPEADRLVRRTYRKGWEVEGLG